MKGMKEKVFRGLLGIIFVSLLIITAGCTSYQQSVSNMLKKQPSHLQNVPASGPTPIDGEWFNPAIGKQVSFISGREVFFYQSSSSLPVFPSVNVRDIKKVAPGRYRGVPVTLKNKVSHVSYSIIGENKLFTRWHYNTGKKTDVVYDKVKLTNEKWFMKEYEAFKTESQGGSGVGQIMGPQIAIHDIHTEPRGIEAGSRFNLIIDYTVTDNTADAPQIPVILQLEVLKSTLSNNVPSAGSPEPPSQDNSTPVHKYKPTILTCPNGEKALKTFHLTATRERGTFYIVAMLKYKEKISRSYVHFTLK